MAKLDQSHPQNVDGSLFVDLSCIDCGTCYHLGPDIFDEARDEHSFVKSQPASPHDWVLAKTAIISCPTNSIGVCNAPLEFREAPVTLPLLISDNVYYCGYTSRDSFGATSYFIEDPRGNILIDSPRFHPTLVRELEERGGVRWMILTHRDDVADHALFASHFQLERVIHQDEVSSATRGVEHQLALPEPFEFLPDLVLIPVPGHTKGHIAIEYKKEFLFTGDHIFFDLQSKNLSASHGVCWYSWEKQIESVKALQDRSFDWVLPGHGGWGYLGPSKSEKMRDLVSRMERQ